MQIYTDCPGCAATLILDQRHKEPYAEPQRTTVVGAETCPHCRQRIEVSILVTRKE